MDYEVLTPVLSLEEALKPDATLLHEEMTTRFKQDRAGEGEDTGEKSNIAGHIQHRLGDVEKGFAQADVIVEREYYTQTVHQGYIEPHVSTANWSADGRVTVWTSTQGAFQIRSLTAAILCLPESLVKVVPMEIGGGFGAKSVTYLDPVAAILSQKSGRPVKIVMDRKGGVRGLWSHVRHSHADQDRRDQGRQDHRRPTVFGLRSRCLPWVTGGWRR